MHLALRFLGSTLALPVRRSELAWVANHLRGGEWALWLRQTRADKRHTLGVARRIQRAGLGKDAVAAALVHDVGKTQSGLGVAARVAVTLAALVLGRQNILERAQRRGGSRLQRAAEYLRHDELGAAMLQAAGARRMAIAWAGGHHSPADIPGIPAEIAEALRLADGD